MSLITKSRQLVKYALEDWSKWIKLDNEVKGYPSKSTGLKCDGGSWGNFLDEQEEIQGSINARAIDAIIAVDSKLMNNSQRSSIYHFHTGAIWKSIRTHIEDDYEEALIILEVNLRKRNLL